MLLFLVVFLIFILNNWSGKIRKKNQLLSFFLFKCKNQQHQNFFFYSVENQFFFRQNSSLVVFFYYSFVSWIFLEQWNLIKMDLHILYRLACNKNNELLRHFFCVFVTLLVVPVFDKKKLNIYLNIWYDLKLIVTAVCSFICNYSFNLLTFI